MPSHRSHFRPRTQVSVGLEHVMTEASIAADAMPMAAIPTEGYQGRK